MMVQTSLDILQASIETTIPTHSLRNARMDLYRVQQTAVALLAC